MTRYRRIAVAALAILALALHPIVVESNDPGAAAVVDARRAGANAASLSWDWPWSLPVPAGGAQATSRLLATMAGKRESAAIASRLGACGER